MNIIKKIKKWFEESEGGQYSQINWHQVDLEMSKI